MAQGVSAVPPEVSRCILEWPEGQPLGERKEATNAEMTVGLPKSGSVRFFPKISELRTGLSVRFTKFGEPRTGPERTRSAGPVQGSETSEPRTGPLPERERVWWVQFRFRGNPSKPDLADCTSCILKFDNQITGAQFVLCPNQSAF